MWIMIKRVVQFGSRRVYDPLRRTRFIVGCAIGFGAVRCELSSSGFVFIEKIDMV